MKILSGGFWIMFVIYALIVDRALTYLPKIPYLSPYTAYASGGAIYAETDLDLGHYERFVRTSFSQTYLLATTEPG